MKLYLGEPAHLSAGGGSPGASSGAKSNEAIDVIPLPVRARCSQRMLEQPHFRRYRTRTILAPWRRAPTGRPRRSIAIRPNIRRRTRRNRRAPRRRGRIRRRSTRRLRICSIPVSAAAAPASARRPASMKRGKRRLLPRPLGGRVGVGGRKVMHESRRLQGDPPPTRVASRPPPLTPPDKGEGKSDRRGRSERVRKEESKRRE